MATTTTLMEGLSKVLGYAVVAGSALVKVP
jgi:hypothetical protein